MAKWKYLAPALIALGSFVLMIALGAISVDGRQLIVDADGGDRDYSTIRSAIGNATDGDRILIRSGTYNESFYVDKELEIRGEEKNSTIIDGWIFVFNVSSGRMEDLTIVNDTWIERCANFTFSSLVIMGDGLDGSYANDCVVEYCRLDSIRFEYSSGNRIVGNRKWSDEGLWISISDTGYWNRWKREGGNWIINNSCTWISVNWANENIVMFNTCSGDGDGIRIRNSYRNIISFNECRNNSGTGILVEDYGWWNYLHGNICTGNAGFGIHYQSGGSTVSENICTDNGGDGIQGYYCHDTRFFNNDCSNNSRYGISFRYWRSKYLVSNNNVLSGNDVSGNEKGIHHEGEMTIIEEFRDLTLCAGLLHIVTLAILGFWYEYRRTLRRQSPGWEKYVERWIAEGYYTLGDSGLILNPDLVKEWNESKRKSHHYSQPPHPPHK